MADLPIVYTLTPEALRTRREGLHSELLRQAEGREDVALALTRIDSAFAGRAYAAYGGIYIAASLGWLWMVEGQTPTRTDMVGAALAVMGALVIIGFAARAR